MPFSLLVSAEDSRALDEEASAEWGFNPYSLIEAAGRSCARVFADRFPELFRDGPKITVAAGTGNNAADAMVMLRCWILAGVAEASSSALVISRMPKDSETGPWVELLSSLKKMKVQVLVWEAGRAAGSVLDDVLARPDIIVDGIAGTGIKGPLAGAALEMAAAINFHRNNPQRGHCPRAKVPFVVSVDLPSGNSDLWKPGMPIVQADLTLAIEPVKYCVYTPSARPYAGMVLNVGAVFPPELIASRRGVEFLDWAGVRERVPKVRPDAYKNERGTVELRAGSAGTTGAALIAARGAQAAGAGLVRLVVDDDIYPILASRAAGIMVAPVSLEKEPFMERFRPDCILLGPGWGTKPGRIPILEKALALEKTGVPLILDADAIELAKGKTFSANVILTPHPGEFSRFTGIDRNELLCRPLPALLKYAKELNALIILKSHVITIVAPDGRLGVVDGMTPGLAAGGSGDLLAGLCAAIAARMKKGEQPFDAYTCAAAAAALLIASGGDPELRSRFTDPLELAGKAADLAGAAWLTHNGKEVRLNG